MGSMDEWRRSMEDSERRQREQRERDNRHADYVRRQTEEWETARHRRMNEDGVNLGPYRPRGRGEPRPWLRIAVGLFLCITLIGAAFDKSAERGGFMLFCFGAAAASLLLVRSGVRILREQDKDWDAPLLPWKPRAIGGGVIVAFCLYLMLQFLFLPNKNGDKWEAIEGTAAIAALGAILLASGLVRRRRWLIRATLDIAPDVVHSTTPKSTSS